MCPGIVKQETFENTKKLKKGMNQRRQDICKKMDRTYIQRSVGSIKHFNFLLQRSWEKHCEKVRCYKDNTTSASSFS
jgi:hypothetical protein